MGSSWVLSAVLAVLSSCPPAPSKPPDSGGPPPDSTAETGRDTGGGCVEDTDTGPVPPDTSPPDTGAHTDTPVDTGGACPPDMALVSGTAQPDYCVDLYEASRPDATATTSGVDESMARSAPGVQPWRVADNAAAEAACGGAGKRLCTPEEWYEACSGPDHTKYAYGDTYVGDTCNGIDTFCTCEDGNHDEGCYYACGGAPALMPTGSFSACTNEYGVFDMNGNLWEHVSGGDDTTIRGGAYNCGQSAAWHACDYVPTDWTPSARGFRCCASPRT